ncbi:MAG: diadenylate cyclase CdaA [Bacteroidota bacterium]
MPFLFYIGFLEVTWVDIIDVLLVAFLIFQLYKLIRGSVAGRVFIGIILIYLVYLVVKAARMELLTAILGQFIGVGVIAALILFQQEIRKFLLMLGKSSLFGSGSLLSRFFGKPISGTELNLQPVLEAAKAMSGSHTGGLIVFSKSTELKFYAESGDLIDALISKRLILSIFNKYSPMHDGAAIISNNRIKAARCILPVTDEADLPAHFGLRHRAALGLCEVTDSVVLVISEETGQLAVAYNGKIEVNLSISEVRSKITHYLFDNPDGDGARHEEHHAVSGSVFSEA